jgi:hypothetical protein
VIQLIGSDGEQMAKHLDNELMDEMAETGFREIWIADYSHNGTPWDGSAYWGQAQTVARATSTSIRRNEVIRVKWQPNTLAGAGYRLFRKNRWLHGARRSTGVLAFNRIAFSLNSIRKLGTAIKP